VTTRDAILDGALEVMRTRGLARTTTKEIARAAGFSEPTLYKFFADKVDLFLCVLAERLPRVSVVSDGISHLVGRGSVAENLRTMGIEIERFYEASLPIAMSVFSDANLLARQRKAVHERGAGPEIIINRVAAYLTAEQVGGRISASAPVEGAAGALVGACMHHAFLARFNDASDEAHADDKKVAGLVNRVVDAILPSLRP
jgi:AcrR family transcriptional regulator